MAKRKTPKTDKIIDLKPEKITEEQLTKAQRLINTIRSAHSELGILEQKKHNLLHGLAGVQDELNLLQEKFKDQYGTNDIDINSGIINYPENGEVNKKD
tara:strand:- start:13 stop:309 length:297 start_codon:yes stop_codon:yes gene_type:complete